MIGLEAIGMRRHAHAGAPAALRAAVARGVACAGLVGLVGCGGAWDPAPFDAYADATRRLGEGTTAVFAADHEGSRRVFVDRLAAGEADTLELVVRFPDDPDSLTVALPRPPVFLVVADAAHQMALLDEALATYADLLAELAGTPILSDTDVATRAASLNASAIDLAGALTRIGVDVPAAFEDRASLVSAAAVEALRTYARERRREVLAEAIASNQDVVDAWVEVASAALENVYDDVQATYTARKRALVRELTEGTAARRRRAAEDLADLQTEVVDVTRTLAELHAGYRAMSGAHRDLGVALTREHPALTALAELHAYTRRVALLTETLDAERLARSGDE